MKIKSITSQHRRDFTAVMECEHCGGEEINRNGYDDSFYHQKVIPAMECKACGESAAEDYRPLSTKYADGVQV